MFARQRGVELVDVVLAHAGQEVQALGIEGCGAGHACRRDDPCREKSRAAQRIGSATGFTENQEPLCIQRVRDSLRVRYDVRDPPAGVAIRPAVTCAVEADQPHPFCPGNLRPERGQESRQRGAMVVDQQRPSGVAVIVDMNHAAVAGSNVELTRLRDRSPHARNVWLGDTCVNESRSAAASNARVLKPPVACCQTSFSKSGA